MRTVMHTAALAAALVAASAAADAGKDFDRTGQVINICGGRPLRISMLETRGSKNARRTSSSYWVEDPESMPKISGGDVIRLMGVMTDPSGPIADEFPHEPAKIVTNIVVVGRGPLPDAHLTNADDVNSGKYIGDFVQISGVVSSVIRDEMNAQWNWFVLRAMQGHVYIAVPEYEHPFDELVKMTDAEVSVYGRCHRQWNWRRFSGHYVIPAGENGIKVTGPAIPPSVAQAMPESATTPRGFGLCRRQGIFTHRVRAEGTIVAMAARFAFVQTPGGHIIKLEPLTGSPMPEPGSGVSATGFLSLDFNGLQMHDTVISPAPEARRQVSAATEPVDLARLYGTTKTHSAFARNRATMTGRVANSHENIRSSGTIRVESDGVSANVDVSALPDETLEGVTAGATIRVTGVCNAEFESDPSTTTFPRFTGFTIVPDCENGIAVLTRPPWWTTGRLVAVIVSLLCALAAISGLCVVLKKLSDRRGRQLYEERAAHVRTQAKIDERTRLAAELHDAVSQTITGVTLQVDSAARAHRAGSDAVGGFLASASKMLASCRRELQDCLWDLRSRTFEEKDMTEAITRTLAPHVANVDTSVRFNVPRDPLSESTTHNILCIVRELVVNAIRHGGARHIWIAGEHHDGLITFSVRDDGSGFDEAQSPGPAQGHFGLQGIRERINPYKGTVTVSSRPGGGAKITVSMFETRQNGS